LRGILGGEAAQNTLNLDPPSLPCGEGDGAIRPQLPNILTLRWLLPRVESSTVHGIISYASLPRAVLHQPGKRIGGAASVPALAAACQGASFAPASSWGMWCGFC